jgi:hypothetical protein
MFTKGQFIAFGGRSKVANPLCELKRKKKKHHNCPRLELFNDINHVLAFSFLLFVDFFAGVFLPGSSRTNRGGRALEAS